MYVRLCYINHFFSSKIGIVYHYIISFTSMKAEVIRFEFGYEVYDVQYALAVAFSRGMYLICKSLIYIFVENSVYKENINSFTLI